MWVKDLQRAVYDEWLLVTILDGLTEGCMDFYTPLVDYVWASRVWITLVNRSLMVQGGDLAEKPFLVNVACNTSS